MQTLRVSKESYALIVGAAAGSFDDSSVRVLPHGVEIVLSDETARSLRGVHRDPDIAIRKMLAPGRTLH